MLALCRVSVAALCLWGSTAHSIGLGQLDVQSSLGRPLRAAILLVGAETVNSTCVKATIESTEGEILAKPRIYLAREKQATSISLQSDKPINEPAVTVTVEITCETPVRRSYQILLDPPAASAELPKADLLLPGRLLSSGVTPADPTENPSETKSRQKTDRDQLTANPRRSTDRKNPPSAKTERLTQVQSARVSQPVLRLSSDTNLSSVTTSIDKLKLEWALSAPRVDSNPKAADEIRAAQNRFAALLRDEDQLKEASAQARTAREQQLILQAEVEVLRVQSQLSKAKLDELQNDKSGSSGWILGLTGLLIASVAMIAWLAWRLKSARSMGQNNWWENAPSNDSQLNEPLTEQFLDTNAAMADQVSVKPVGRNIKGGKIRETNEDRLFEKRLEPRLAANTEHASPQSEAGARSNFSHNGLLTDSNPDTLPPTLRQVELIRAEEVSDTLQEVEFWMLLNDRSRALEILEPLSNVEKPDSPAPWLYLLDTYAETGDKAKYEALRERCEHVFNVRIAKWADKNAEGNSRGLDEFSHLMDEICGRWKSDSIVTFLEGLLVDNREGSRAGFELSAYRDLMLLIALAKEIQPPKPMAESAAA
jgi:hypothetical protein